MPLEPSRAATSTSGDRASVVAGAVSATSGAWLSTFTPNVAGAERLPPGVGPSDAVATPVRAPSPNGALSKQSEVAKAAGRGTSRPGCAGASMSTVRPPTSRWTP